MAKDWGATFSFWGAAPSDTEQDKCGNAERAIRKAIAASTVLASKTIDVFVQGSYANGTNVRQDSDVDVCILYKNAFFPDYSHAPTLSNFALGLENSAYTYTTFKNDVEAALVSYFKRTAVKRGNKAFDIRENTYRIDADVVPCFEHRLYSGDAGGYSYRSGTELCPDNGSRITNWPKQNFDNGVTKNDNTGRKFKAVTRILKNLRFAMIDDGDKTAEAIPSYLIECLVWNVPNTSLGLLPLSANVRDSIAWLWDGTKTDESCNLWTEVNGIKYLFRVGQPWTREQVHGFLLAVWRYVGFE
jgi:predicted nucleotidyltransferase